MNKFITRVWAMGVLLVLPVVAVAQIQEDLGEIGQSVGNLGLFINNILIPFVFALALLVFIWGAFRYFIYGGDNEENRKEGSKLMIYGIVGFVLMVSVFGIVNLIVDGLGLDDDTELSNLPTVPTRDSGGGFLSNFLQNLGF